MFYTTRFRISILTIVLVCTAKVRAQPRTFELDPAQTKIAFTLGTVLHTVHGSFNLKRGSIRFDDSTGEASGELVVDALSGESGNSSRDKKMHKENLESSMYSDIAFTPKHIKGTVARDGKSQVTVDGLLALHGQSHPMILTIDLWLQHGAGSVDTAFVVPYETWGVKNPSTFILRVSDKVEINVHAFGRLTPATATPSAH
ncbi:MAG TPA: YceI family protein [Terriglobales bacterium]